MKIVIFLGYQSYTSVHANNGISQELPSVQSSLFFLILTSILTAVKTDLHEYHDTCFSRSGVNRMWILKNSKDLLDLTVNEKQDGDKMSLSKIADDHI